MNGIDVPPNACDTHVHIFSADGIARSGANVAVAELEDYRLQRAALGVARTVLVQPTAFAFDNGCMLQSMTSLGSSARGIAMVERDVASAELERLHGLGVRGARLHLLKNPRQSWDDVVPLADRVAPLGWHLQIQCNGHQLPEHLGALASLPTKLVLDQCAKFVEPVTTRHPAFRSLLTLLEKGRTYVKLSAPYETSKAGPPGYEDVSVLARELVRLFPDRMLWASNWPHTMLQVSRKPSDAALLALLADWAPEAAVRERILVETPASLYGF